MRIPISQSMRGRITSTTGMGRDLTPPNSLLDMFHLTRNRAFCGCDQLLLFTRLDAEDTARVVQAEDNKTPISHDILTVLQNSWPKIRV